MVFRPEWIINPFYGPFDPSYLCIAIMAEALSVVVLVAMIVRSAPILPQFKSEPQAQSLAGLNRIQLVIDQHHMACPRRG